MKSIILTLISIVSVQSYGDVKIRAFIPNSLNEKAAVIHDKPIHLESSQISYKKVRFEIYGVRANGEEGYLDGQAGSWGIEFHIGGIGNTQRMNLVPQSEQARAELRRLDIEKVYNCKLLNYTSSVGFGVNERTPAITLFLDSISCEEL